MKLTLAVMIAAAILAFDAAAQGRSLNGFELTPAEVPVAEILRGGPPRDGIPALFDPAVVPAAEASWSADDVVMGIVVGGEARAYPIRVLDWHELVNDTVGGRKILVTYCPLCGTGLVFDREVAGAVRTFGVSGLLYRSDVLFYDHESESLWSQIASRAVTGPSLGSELELVRSVQTRWSEWRAAHPKTTVLSRDTGHRRDYGRTPYAGYSSSAELYFPAEFERRYPPKMPTVGVRIRGGEARAYPAEEVVKVGGRVAEQFSGRPVSVAYDAGRRVFDVEAPDDVEVIEGYWFAWSAFHPDSSVYVAPER